MLIAVSDMVYISKLKSQLNSEFDVKDLGATKKILGIEIYRHRGSGKLWLSQQYYIQRVLKRFNMSNSKPISIPLAACFKLFISYRHSLMMNLDT